MATMTRTAREHACRTSHAAVGSFAVSRFPLRLRIQRTVGRSLKKQPGGEASDDDPDADPTQTAISPASRSTLGRFTWLIASFVRSSSRLDDWMRLRTM